MRRLYNSLKNSKLIKYTLRIVIIIFAIIGFGLTSAFVAVKLKLTNDSGQTDLNSRYFKEIADKYEKKHTYISLNINEQELEIYRKILLIQEIYPINAKAVLRNYLKTKNIEETFKMIDAIYLRMQNDTVQFKKLANLEKTIKNTKFTQNNTSVFKWMNISEWIDFKYAVAKDKEIIDSVSKITGVEPRLIVSCLVGEQIRLFNSKREAYKKWIGPLKILSVETTFSFGVTGIKKHTAEHIEKHLVDSNSVFYLGKEYSKLITYNTDSIDLERFNRLTNYHNHYYSYLYTALFLKQINKQWNNAGFPINNRPEIFATIFNLGFTKSIPKENPQVGGATIIIDNLPYSFGTIAYDFYYSGDLLDIFPFTQKKI